MARDRTNRRMAVSPSALGKVVEVFERNFRDRGELGASVSIWWDGVELLIPRPRLVRAGAIAGVDVDTLVPVYSATKVPAAATLLLALASRGLERGNSGARGLAAFPGGGRRVSVICCPTSAAWPRLDRAGQCVGSRRGGGGHRSPVPGMAVGRRPWLSPADLWRAGGRTGAPPHRPDARRLLAGDDRRARWSSDFWIGLPETEWPRVARSIPARRARTIWRMLFTSNSPPPAPSPAGRFPRRAGCMRSMK